LRRRLLLQGGAGALSVRSVAPVFAQAERVRVGLTAVILADQAAFLTRWAQYLSGRLATQVTFAVRDSYQAILDMLFAGELDAAWICGFPYVRYQRQLRLLAVPLYQGQPTYQSYLIRPRAVRPEDATVRGWSDLRGKVFAYSDPLSNSGWLVAQGQLAAAGIASRDLKRSFFAHGHRHVAEAVAARLAHAGSIDGYVWETMREQQMGAAGQTEVIWKSIQHGFPPLVAPLGAGHFKIDELQRTLLAMKSDEAGRSLLNALNLDGFVAGTPALFASIRSLALTVAGSGVAA
jgi:phosphonate transport system substrate-binding protein